MKYKTRISTIILIALLSLTGLFLIPDCGSEEDKAETAAGGQLWTCGMHPEVIVDQPGQCPKCGMNLKYPVKQAGSEQAAVQTADQKPQGERKILLAGTDESHRNIRPPWKIGDGYGSHPGI